MSDSLVGCALGKFEIEEEIGQGRWGRVYRALQRSMNRTVALRVLDPATAAQPGAVEQFLEEARAEAQLTHANIVQVFEAGEASGYYFCAMEYMDGLPVTEFLRKGEHVDDHHLLRTIASAARGLDYLWAHKVPHQSLTLAHMQTDAAGELKLADLLPGDAAPVASPRNDITALGITLARATNDIGPVQRAVSELVERMFGAPGRKPFNTLAEVAAAAEEMDRKLFPPTTPHPAAAEPEKKKQTPVQTIIMVAVLLGLAGGAFWLWKGISRSIKPSQIFRPDDIGSMVQIPAGEFIYKNGAKTNLPAFYIDKYEVTNAEYNKFLEAVANKEPFKPHPFTPKTDFKPVSWDKILRAIEEGQLIKVGNQEVWPTWDSAVIGVTWYEAYAYANWRGKRLPTQAEWEKAARGTDGRLYPWGNEPVSGNSNVEGYSRNMNVYAYSKDVSPFGVIGLAGNADEWTGDNTRTSAFICGGNWQLPAVPMTNRIERALDARNMATGFRCASDKDVKP
jgi:serine/threonine-protein kinase